MGDDVPASFASSAEEIAHYKDLLETKNQELQVLQVRDLLHTTRAVDCVHGVPRKTLMTSRNPALSWKPSWKPNCGGCVLQRGV